jgi:hypothetical protein
VIKIDVIAKGDLRTLFLEASKPNDKDEIDALDGILAAVMNPGVKKAEFLATNRLAITIKMENTES